MSKCNFFLSSRVFTVQRKDETVVKVFRGSDFNKARVHGCYVVVEKRKNTKKQEKIICETTPSIGGFRLKSSPSEPNSKSAERELIRCTSFWSSCFLANNNELTTYILADDKYSLTRLPFLWPARLDYSDRFQAAGSRDENNKNRGKTQRRIELDFRQRGGRGVYSPRAK